MEGVGVMEGKMLLYEQGIRTGLTNESTAMNLYDIVLAATTHRISLNQVRDATK